MALDIELGTPQAATLQNAVQTKLMELGWGTDSLDDTSLTEYIMLMLASGEGKEKLVTDISEFVSVDSQDASLGDFLTWLFEEAERIFGSATGEATQTAQLEPLSHNDGQSSANDVAGPQTAEDTEMGDDKDGQDSAIPTGPKSMRNAPQRSRDRRMLGQVNKALDRSNDGMLHRIKGAAGRVNSHSHDPTKGPAPRGPRATMQRFAGRGGPQHPHMSMNPANQGNMFGAMSPQQQMQLFAMYEEQARMMAQILSPQQQQQIFLGQPSQQPQQQQGKSLFERIDHGQNTDASNQRQQHNAGDTFSHHQTDPTSSMEVESNTQDGNRPEPTSTMCKFNLACTKPDCPFAHQSPAAPAGSVVDMTDECAFGAACKNRKCAGKHPSPAKLGPQRAEQDCRFFPNCTNPNCPFRHPSMPPCRNGADCNVEGCRFSHTKVACRFDPCLNPSCPYKHAEGQKRGAFADKVWVKGTEDGENGEGGQGSNQEGMSHLSDRKFVDENAGDEELIRPGQGEQAAATDAAVAT